MTDFECQASALRRASVSVVIPTCNGGGSITQLLEALNRQTQPPDEIIIVDSQSTDGTIEHCLGQADIIFIPIERKSFDHGGTRDMALRQSKGEFILFLTQDALPCRKDYIENLLKPFEDPAVAMVSGRQVAKADSSQIEKLTREFNYPPNSHVRSFRDIERLGVKAFFTSNVCSAYRRSAYIDVDGFEYPIIISEDMIIAAKLLQAGYKISYCADAAVYHSHSLSLKKQFRRNFDIGVCMRMYEPLFHGVKTRSEGIRMARFVITKLFKEGHLLQGISYCIDCVARLLGHWLGGRYGSMRPRIVQYCTLNKFFWDNPLSR